MCLYLTIAGRWPRNCEAIKWNFVRVISITAASGHVKSGQTYLEGAQEEVKEELGVDNLQLELIAKDLYDREGIGKLFLASYKAKHNGHFFPGTDHVERIEFFSLEKLQEMINKGGKIHPEFLFLLRKHFNIQ